jgi:hypothetical protein
LDFPSNYRKLRPQFEARSNASGTNATQMAVVSVSVVKSFDVIKNIRLIQTPVFVNTLLNTLFSSKN